MKVFFVCGKDIDMKSHLLNVADKTGEKVPCYYMPKSFLTEIKLSSYSLDSKLLAGIMLSVANSGESMVEAAKLINDLGAEYLNNTIKELNQEVGSRDMNV